MVGTFFIISPTQLSFLKCYQVARQMDIEQDADTVQTVSTNLRIIDVAY